MTVTERDKNRARAAVTNAIQKGLLVRRPCEQCGKEPADGHHDDYSQPLTVRWLCRSHHRQLHEDAKGPKVEGRTIGARITRSEYVEIRKEAITRGLHTGDWVAQLIQAGRERLRALDKEEGVT